jgi:biotin carboxylase
VSVDGATVAVVGAGYPGKRRAYVRMAELGARLVVLDEPGHWSESLVAEGVAAAWLPTTVDGDPDRDAQSILAALGRAGIRPDGVLTFWEDSISAAARVAAALDRPGNPPAAVDAARSKVRTRELAARLGLPTPRAKRVQSLDELFAAAAEVGFPAVVKPEFGAGALGCIRVDDAESLAGIYTIVRRVVNPQQDTIFRAGNDLLLEEYLDGVEFDVDLVMQEGECLFSSVSQNWPTAEPSFQETGLHCPPDHDRKDVRRLVRHVVEAVRGFGLSQGVLHVEGKCTSRGPRIVEVNARMGGGCISTSSRCGASTWSRRSCGARSACRRICGRAGGRKPPWSTRSSTRQRRASSRLCRLAKSRGVA